MNYIDIIIIIFIGMTCFEGYRRGFIKMLFDTIGLIAAFLLSKEFYYIAEQFLSEKTRLYYKVHEFFENKAVGLTEILQNNSDNIANSFREALKLPIELQNFISHIFVSETTSGAENFEIFVDKISIIVVRSISFLITFLIIYIILLIIVNLINIIFKLPVLNLTNRLFGSAIGFLKSIIILYIIFALSSPVIGFIQNNFLIDGILSSEASKIFYDNNLILNYLSYKGFYEN